VVAVTNISIRWKQSEERQEFSGAKEISMPSEGSPLCHCYNRGCGQKFDPNENTEGNRESLNGLYV
jgi:hypothetical protein